MYEAEAISTKQQLDKAGMALIALLSGEKYTPDGIPGCGMKVACQVARAGFGQFFVAMTTGQKVERLRLETIKVAIATLLLH